MSTVDGSDLDPSIIEGTLSSAKLRCVRPLIEEFDRYAEIVDGSEKGISSRRYIVVKIRNRSSLHRKLNWSCHLLKIEAEDIVDTVNTYTYGTLKIEIE